MPRKNTTKKDYSLPDDAIHYLSTLENGFNMGNYKNVCNNFCQPIISGTSKISQIKDWERYFKWHNDGHNYIFNELYTNPKPITYQKLDDSIYTKFIELLLMYELSQKEGYSANYTRTKLFKLLGLVNENYMNLEYSSVKEIFSDRADWEINKFYQNAGNKRNKILSSAMRSMKRRRLLDYYEAFIIVRNGIAEDGTDKERKLYLEAGKSVLSDMHCKYIPFNRISEYYCKLTKKLQERYGWERAFQEVRLIYSQKYIAQDIPVVESEFKSMMRKNSIDLNKNFTNFLEEQARSQYSKRVEFENELISGDVKKYIDNDLYTKDKVIKIAKKQSSIPDDYIDGQLKLIQFLISTQPEDNNLLIDNINSNYNDKHFLRALSMMDLDITN